jgi:hypothetical protein
VIDRNRRLNTTHILRAHLASRGTTQVGQVRDAAKVKKKNLSRDALRFDNPFALL